MIIAVDFDGTLVDHRFPEIGAEAPGAFKWLHEFQKAGAKLILWTMRSDVRGEGIGPEGFGADRDYLTEAVVFCRSRGIEFWAVNKNPRQGSWTDSPKAYAHLYIDDAAFGVPVREAARMGSRPIVDWDVVGPCVMAMIEAKRGVEA